MGFYRCNDFLFVKLKIIRKKGAVAKCNYSTINGGFEILKSRYIVVKIHFATAP